MNLIAAARRRLRGSPPAAGPQAVDMLSDADRRIVERALPFTMTSPERLAAVVDAVRYVVERGVPGSFAECGVWRGGSVLAMLLTLQDLAVADRDVHLYDTFAGMTEPGDLDTSPHEAPALETWGDGGSAWGGAFAPDVYGEEQVRATLEATGYPPERLHIVKGPVEETLPGEAPETLALLRLDTDWYASTRHELEHLYPRLSDGGVLIIDDFGHWDGARRAVEEYFRHEAAPLLLNRIDYTGRIAVKH